VVSPESNRHSCAWSLRAPARMDVERRFKLVKLRDLFHPIYECFSSGLAGLGNPKCISFWKWEASYS
jgi:hypothetical protein